MSLLVGRISYLPNSEVRTKRLEASRFQFDWLCKSLPNTEKLSVCQAYASDELPNDAFMTFDNGIGPAKARNLILEHFYNSDYDWLFLCDDDTIIDDKYSPMNFVAELSNNISKFKEIDAVSAVEPEYHPYKTLNFKDKGNLTHYKFEPRELNSGSATSFIRNINKYYGKEVYYPDIDARTGEGHEDMEFLFDWLKQGLNWYTMDTLIRKSLCFDKSSLFGSDTKSRDKLLMGCLDRICERYASDGLMREVNGKITWRNFNDRYNTSKKLLYIEREKPIEFEPNVLPKEKQDLTNNLF